MGSGTLQDAGSTEPQILVVDDDPDIQELTLMFLRAAGFAAIAVDNGRDALSLAFTECPSLILLDRDMPEMDGIEVLARLRAHLQTRHVPVIMLTARSAVSDRVGGLDAGADDYVTKPYASAELIARVSGALRRRDRDVAADPLTKLPGNLAIREEVARRWGASFSVSYFDLDHFKAYVDHYGFENASDVIQKVAHILHDTVTEFGTSEDFVGHIGGDDFLLICEPQNAESICRTIRGIFRDGLKHYYKGVDYDAGHIEGVDRYGAQRRFELLDLSIAIIDVAADAPPSSNELGAVASLGKKAVKYAVGDAKVQRFTYPAAAR